MFLLWSLSTCSSFCLKLSSLEYISLGFFPHHLEISLNVACFIRFLLIIHYPLCLSILLPIFVYNIYSLHCILIYLLPGPHQRLSAMRAGITSFALCFIPALRKCLTLNCAQIFKWMNGWNSFLELEDYVKCCLPTFSPRSTHTK